MSKAHVRNVWNQSRVIILTLPRLDLIPFLFQYPPSAVPDFGLVVDRNRRPDRARGLRHGTRRNCFPFTSSVHGQAYSKIRVRHSHNDSVFFDNERSPNVHLRFLRQILRCSVPSAGRLPLRLYLKVDARCSASQQSRLESGLRLSD